MIQVIENITRPAESGFTSEEINQQLLCFCANCPDPMAAMDLVVECMTPMTPEELVDRALQCPARDVAAVPFSGLVSTHPLRHMEVES
jgi:hypothetical protein